MIRTAGSRKLIALMLLIVILSGCGVPIPIPAPISEGIPGETTPQSTAAAAPAENAPAELVIGYAGYPTTTLIDRALYQTLVRYQADGSIGPDLALDWSISDDFTDVVFYLDPDAQFSSGEPVTAEDVADSIRRVQKFTTPLTESIEAVEVIDDYTLRLILKRPDVDILSKLSVETFRIQNEENLGSGPYQVESRVDNDWILVLNPYYRTQEQYPGLLIFRYVADSVMQADLLRAGELDVALNLSPQEASDVLTEQPERLRGRGGIDSKIISLMPNLTAFEQLGIHNPDALRQALHYAIDREGIRQAFATDGVIPASIVPIKVTDESYQEQENTYDPGRANDLLQEAGFDFDRVYGLGYIPRSSAIYEGLSNEMLAQVVQQNLAEVGIQSDLISIPADQIQLMQESGNLPEFLLLDHRPLYPSSTAALDYLPGGIIANLIGFNDEELAVLAEELKTVTDEAERDTLMGFAEEALTERGPYNPILKPPVYVVYDEVAESYLWRSAGLNSSSFYVNSMQYLSLCPTLNTCQSTCQVRPRSFMCRFVCRPCYPDTFGN